MDTIGKAARQSTPHPAGLVLAPMAGYSDEPFRRICRRLGSAMSYSEFVSAEAVSRENLKTFRILRFADEERPVIFQVFGHRLETLVNAALRLEELGPDGIDLNLGCSVHKVVHKGAGAGLLRDSVQIGRIIEALAKRLSVPVSAKMRLGWDETSRNYLEVARVVQEGGASMLAVHGRTASQAYSGHADWEAIGEIKSRLSIPVFGNGDVKTYTEARDRMRQYGVDGVLIGRAAQGNPWIFTPAAKISLDDVAAVMQEHLGAMLDFHGPLHGHLRFRKHALQYLRRFPGAASARARMIHAGSAAEMLSEIERLKEVAPA